MDTFGKDDDDFIIIWRPWITLPSGKRIYAKWSGKKAFPIRVRRSDPKQPRLPGL